MQIRQQHDDTSSALLSGKVVEDDDASDPRGHERDAELQRYDEEEIVTKPWPPQQLQ